MNKEKTMKALIQIGSTIAEEMDLSIIIVDEKIQEECDNETIANLVNDGSSHTIQWVSKSMPLRKWVNVEEKYSSYGNSITVNGLKINIDRRFIDGSLIDVEFDDCFEPVLTQIHYGSKTNKIMKLITRILSMVEDQKKEAFLETLCNNEEFCKDQIDQIRQGLEAGIFVDDIKIYADPRFNSAQIKEIRLGLINDGISDVVDLYADPKYSYNQMREIRYGLEGGLTEDQIETYADPDYCWNQMREIYSGLECGLTKEQISLYADPKYDGNQMHQIRYGLENGLTKDQIELYADPQYNDDQMQQIRFGLENGLSKDEIILYADPKFNSNQMYDIRWGFENGLTKEQVSLYADPKCSDRQMYKISRSLQKRAYKRPD